MHINSRKENWVEGIETWDLISYSVPQNICSLNARDSIAVRGFFQHGTPRVRLSVLLDMLDGIPGITMTWTAMHLGRGCSLVSNSEYQAFLAASTKEKEVADSNPNLMIRVNVRGSTGAPPKRRGFAPGNRPPRPPLAPLNESL